MLEVVVAAVKEMMKNGMVRRYIVDESGSVMSVKENLVCLYIFASW